MSSRRSFFLILGPGLLVAATGVGAGDLATGAFTGSKLGTAVLWAACAGALLKFALTEGLARWQIATGETILQGAMLRFGRTVRALFLLYLIAWSWFVGSALVSGCGAATHAMLPFFDASVGKQVFGVTCSILGLGLVLRGGYAVFEQCMRICILFMFATVLTTAALLVEDWPGVARGLFIPTIPDLTGEGLAWTVALIGGVGGTLTILCYGYWIQESGRDGKGDLKLCRIDLTVGYGVTALFGAAMVALGSGITVPDAKGAALVIQLADHIEKPLGPIARWAFLIGAWGAFFSSLLGVWQSVPYIFADFIRTRHDERPETPHAETRAYKGFLIGLATLPLVGLWISFKTIQQYYAIIGALFLPLLAVALLVLNNRKDLMGEHRNGWLGNLMLTTVLLFFLGVAVHKWI